MAYTVGKIAELLDIPRSTIRFYDKKGLLPFVGRSPGGIRQFTENDRRRLENILLLRRFGFTIEEIKRYVELEEEGRSTVSMRLDMLEKRKESVISEIRSLSDTLSLIEKTCRQFTDEKH